MNTTHVSDTWPHANALKTLRARTGGLSVERAAARIDVSRATWHAWESGKQRPTHDSLKAIVEAFECPPEMVGYEPPRGWTLVPEQWIRDQHEEQMQMLRRITEALKIL